MKPTLRLFLIGIGLLALLALAGCAPAQSSDGIIVGRSYRLSSGDKLDHDLAIFGGSAILEKGSSVDGSVTIFGGSLVVDGEVTGDVSAFGGVVSLDNNALVHGDVVTFGASISRSESAVVKGSVGASRPGIRVPNFVGPTISNGFKALTDVIWRIFQSFALAALAVLASLFVLRPMERAGDAMVSQVALSGGMGLLTLLAGSFVLVLMAITILLIPVSLIGFILLAVGSLFGWLVLGLVTGERLAHLFHQEWSGPVSAGLGTLVFSLAMNLMSIIPCIGWVIVPVAFLVGLGGVVLTRFGTQSYPPRPSNGVSPVPPASSQGDGGIEVA
jgi:hypothetical protein